MSKYAIIGPPPYFEVVTWVDSNDWPGAVPDPVPENYIEVTAEQYQADGHWTVLNGEIVRSYLYDWFSVKNLAIIALQKADITVIRTLAAGIPIPPDWIAYKVAMRTLYTTTIDFYIPAPPFQERPDYPAGS